MDIAGLLSHIGPNSDKTIKSHALERAFAIVKVNRPDLIFQDFIEAISEEIVSTDFGNEGENNHYTTVFAGVSSYGLRFDPVLSSIINHHVVELTYQTRFLRLGSPEVAIIEGHRDQFPLYMAYANVVFGVCVSGQPAKKFDLPEWATKLWLEINGDLLAECDLSNLKLVLDVNGRDRVGFLACQLDDHQTSEPMLSVKYVDIAERFSEFTSYLFHGPIHLVVDLSKRISAKYPSSRIYVKAYSAANSLNGIAAIASVSGVQELLQIDLVLRRIVPCRFVNIVAEVPQEYKGVIPIQYRDWEECQPKRPFAVSSSAALPDEIRFNTSRRGHIHHKIVKIDGGYLIPCVDKSNSTYIHMSGSGDIISNYGNEVGSAHRTKIYTDGITNSSGVRESSIDLSNVFFVAGPAMPLLFTPDLHNWFSHFMIQCLPRVNILREIGLPEAKILIPEDLKRKQIAMLRMAGVSDHQIVRVPVGMICQADELIVPSAWGLVFSEFTLSVYDTILDRLGRKKIFPTKRILISRESRKSWRNMLNFDAVRQLLIDDYQFELVHPETLSLEDEVDLFQQARIVVGAEGAGLYVGCFAQSNSAFISISDEDYAMPILGSLASIRGFEIGYVFGESFRSDLDLSRRLPFGHTDWVVNPARVASVVKAAMEILPSEP